jgi:mono/diheme cytochrome c family protein
MRPMILVTMTSALVFSGASAQTSPAGNAQNGKKIFISYGCYECHGREAQGGAGTGPRLGPRPVAFTAFSKYVRQPSAQMPPYTRKVVSDRELADMYAFLQSLPQPSPAKNIPLLEDLK